MSGSTKRPKGGASLTTLPNDYVIVDTETTGLSFDWCDIIEIGAARVVDGIVVERFTELVRVDYSLPLFITELTGITDEMLACAKTKDEVIHSFAEFAGGSTLMAHNANFDMTFLYLAYVDVLGVPLTNDFVDTLRVSRKALPKLGHHRAKDVCAALGVTNEHEHRALPDAIAEHECYQIMRQQLIEQYGEEGYASLFKGNTGKKFDLRDLVAQGDPNEDSPLFEANVVFTGKMASMVRRDAQQALKNIGGEPQPGIRRNTDYLVIGNDGFREELNGESAKMRKARANQLKGLPIRVISEDAFLEMLVS